MVDWILKCSQIWWNRLHISTRSCLLWEITVDLRKSCKLDPSLYMYSYVFFQEQWIFYFVNKYKIDKNVVTFGKKIGFKNQFLLQSIWPKNAYICQSYIRLQNKISVVQANFTAVWISFIPTSTSMSLGDWVRIQIFNTRSYALLITVNNSQFNVICCKISLYVQYCKLNSISGSNKNFTVFFLNQFLSIAQTPTLNFLKILIHSQNLLPVSYFLAKWTFKCNPFKCFSRIFALLRNRKQEAASENELEL